MVNSAAISSIDCSPIVQLYNNSAGTTKNSRCSLFKYQSDYILEGGKLRYPYTNISSYIQNRRRFLFTKGM
uniref:Uncharacterized protein n=1 Tax=Cycas panzhihuaensis TaxID=123604 RepID=A0A1D8BF09_CYCPA|nr:hypothetical protein [Cycas panzhihuaensis]AOS53191.1 hypothetical protein [Cycas panzhihuaensis]